MTFTRMLSTACILFVLEGEVSLTGLASCGVATQKPEEAVERIKEEIDSGKLKDLGFAGRPDRHGASVLARTV